MTENNKNQRPEIGQKAPTFTLLDSFGNQVSLEDFFGKKVVIYFYPKDNTPGCTKEACSFRDKFEDYVQKGMIVLGISPDGQESHQKFINNHNLPGEGQENFILLSDPEKKVLKPYGAWGEKNLYGKITIGVKRSTFIVDELGNIEKVYKRPQTKTHAGDILNDLS